MSNRVRNARLIGASNAENNPTTPGIAVSRWARSWLAAATRCPTRSLRARHNRRSNTVSSASTSNRVNRNPSVRTTSANTNASNRSSLFPADPYRPRNALTCPGAITNTGNRACSSTSTTGPSPRSIPTAPTPWRRSTATNRASPAALCATVTRSSTRPRSSSTHTT